MTVAGARSDRGDVDRNERGRDEQRRPRARPPGDPARLVGGEEEAALVSAGDQAGGAGGVALAGAGEHGGRAGERGGGGEGDETMRGSSASGLRRLIPARGFSGTTRPGGRARRGPAGGLRPTAGGRAWRRPA